MPNKRNKRKRCSSCHKYKGHASFYQFKRGKHKGRLYWYCKDCAARANKLQYAATNTNDSARWRELHLEKEFGLTIEQYATLLAVQGGVCAICQRPERSKRRGKTKRLAVDHDHTTGKIRALLCSACNLGIGKFNESPEYLLAAAAYLSQHQPPPQ